MSLDLAVLTRSEPMITSAWSDAKSAAVPFFHCKSSECVQSREWKDILEASSPSAYGSLVNECRMIRETLTAG